MSSNTHLHLTVRNRNILHVETPIALRKPGRRYRHACLSHAQERAFVEPIIAAALQKSQAVDFARCRNDERHNGGAPLSVAHGFCSAERPYDGAREFVGFADIRRPWA